MARSILPRAMNASPIMSAADTRHLLALSVAASAVDAPAESSGAGLLLKGRQLDDARAQLRDGESFSVKA
jgi:hypothetical protein